ncbi:MAG TPA: PAS domain S-box protein [Victivallales bacterium]|nr:PAS domain S-box protein [Victivallales bacterium]HRR28996.1 PAS domain S-box protein [Victivallales bacterium]
MKKENNNSLWLRGLSIFVFMMIITSSVCFIDKTILKDNPKLYAFIIHLVISIVVTISYLFLHKKLSLFAEILKSKNENESRLLDAIRKSEERYRAIFDSATDALILIDKENGKITEFNHSLLKLTGFEENEILKLSAEEIEDTPNNNIKVLLDKKEKNLFTTKKSITFITYLKRKNSIPVKVSATLNQINICDRDYLLISFHDISEEELISMQLQEQMHFSETLLEIVPVPIFYKNKQGRYIGCNSAFEKLIGFRKDQIIGKTVYDIAPKEIAEEYHKKDQELFEKPGIQTYNWKVISRTGEIKNVIFYKTVYKNKKGEVIGLIGSVIDLTEIQQKNRELKLSYERWQRTFDAFDDMVFVIDKSYNILFSNTALKKNFYGEFVDGAKCFKIIHGVDSQPDSCPCKNVFEDGLKRNIEIFLNQLNSYFDCSFYPVKDQKGNVEQVIHIMRNINARKKAEIELTRSRNLLLNQNKSLVKFTDAANILTRPLDKFLKDLLIELSTTLKITYASIWFFNTDKTKLSCAYQYNANKSRFDNSSEELIVKDYPGYFETILHDKLVSADNAHTDPGTIDLLSSYLIPKGIRSMMDCLITLGKEPLGIICCEHTGDHRNWTIEEANYLISMANIVSLYMQTSKAENTERNLLHQLTKFNNLLSYTDVGIMVVDEQKTVVFINKTSEIFFGEKIKNILGNTCPEKILNNKNGEISIIRKNGKTGKAFLMAEPCSWEGKKAEIFTITDITDLHNN